MIEMDLGGAFGGDLVCCRFDLVCFFRDLGLDLLKFSLLILLSSLENDNEFDLLLTDSLEMKELDILDESCAITPPLDFFFLESPEGSE